MDKGIEAGSTENVDKAKGLVGSLPGRGREVKKNGQAGRGGRYYRKNYRYQKSLTYRQPLQAGEGDAGQIEEQEVQKSGNAAETEDRLVFVQLDREEEDFGKDANKLAHL